MRFTLLTLDMIALIFTTIIFCECAIQQKHVWKSITVMAVLVILSYYI